MNNKILISVCATAACGLAWAAKDPVIMTINGVDVPRSEFEYLYHKNSQQQLEPQTLEEYAETFKVYKLKVADARAEGLDTTSSFLREMAQYRRDLAAPYITDSAYINSLVDLSYSRAGEEVEASHIMLMKQRGSNLTQLKNQADSLHALLVDGADFADLSSRYNQDKRARANGGVLGYIAVNRLPYEFEDLAFTLKEGEISDVLETQYGFHILKGGKHRPSIGQVFVKHIMKMVPRGASEADEVRAKEQIDSVYNLVTSKPDQFESVAISFSDDKGSGRQGGALPWFGSGDMVPAFEEASFSLANGEISKPVRSEYGWHIIKKVDSRGIPEKEQFKAELLRRMGSPNDFRARMIRRHQSELLERTHKASLDNNVISGMREAALQGVDSVYLYNYTSGPLAGTSIGEIDGKPIPASEFVSTLRLIKSGDPVAAGEVFDLQLERYYNKMLLEAEEARLEATEPDYRNLLNEYREGSLLFEISSLKAWDKAAKDTEGLQKYFNAHRGDYAWEKPRAKGILVQAANDSVAAAAMARMKTLGGDTVVVTLRKEFGNKIKAERVLAAQGTNPMVDAVMFGGREVKPSNSAFTTYFLYDGRVLSTPEDVNDVKGQVTSDYQNALMDEWVEELKVKYPVKINYKELKKVK